MKTLIRGSAMILCAFLAMTSSGATRFVDASSGAPSAPYTSWATAARAIQDAIDVAVAGDDVIVTNGVYATGGRVASDGTLTNRVAVDKPVAVRSVNGPHLTVIQGYQVPGVTNGEAAIRCVYLANGATLSGFTLTNGATKTVIGSPDYLGGGVYCESSNATVVNCILAGNSGSAGGGSFQGTLTNCILAANRAIYGGGSWSSMLYGCQLTNNMASSRGGGAFDGSLNNCLLRANQAGGGGGAEEATLANCIVSANVALNDGGGADNCVLVNCIITGNAAVQGGGISSCLLTNCLLTGNWATDSGGGAYSGTFYNCTLAGNSATNRGGGGYGFDSFHIHANCVLYNSIIYSNQAAFNPDCACTQYDSCLPSEDGASGANNISNPSRIRESGRGEFPPSFHLPLHQRRL